MAAATSIVITAIATAAASIAGAGAAAGATFGLTAISFAAVAKAFAVGALLGTGLHLIQRFALAPNASTKSIELLSTRREAISEAQWILGEARVGGDLIWVFHTVPRKRYRELHLCFLVSEGPCERITKVFNKGEEIPLSRQERAQGALLTGTGDAADRIWVHEYFKADGTQGADIQNIQRDPWDDETTLNWTKDHKVNGKSWIYVRCRTYIGKQSNPADSDDKFWKDFPQLTFVVKGLKFTWPGVDVNTWTDNAAAVRYWFESVRKGRAADEFDSASFMAAYARCDGEVDHAIPDILPPGVEYTKKTKRYSINGVIKSGVKAKLLEREFDFCWAGKVVYVDGVAHFVPGGNKISVGSFVEDDIIEAGPFYAAPALQSRANSLTMSLVQSNAHDWTAFDMGEVVDNPALDRDITKLPLDLGANSFIQNPLIAHRLMVIHLRKRRQTGNVTFRLKPGDDLERIGWKPTDRIQANCAEFGFLDFALEVNKTILNDDISYTLACTEYLDGVYDDVATFPPLIPRNINLQPGIVPPPPVTDLHATPIARAMKDGTLKVFIKFTWRQELDSFVARTDVRYRRVVAANQDNEEWIYASVDDSPLYADTDVVIDQSYQYQARHVSPSDDISDWTDIAVVAVTGDLEPPANVKGLNVVGIPSGFRASWTPPTEGDFSHTEIQWRVDEAAQWNLRVYEKSSVYEDHGFPAPTMVYLRFRHVDRSGNQSAWAEDSVMTLMSAEDMGGGVAIYEFDVYISVDPPAAGGTAPTRPRADSYNGLTDVLTGLTPRWSRVWPGTNPLKVVYAATVAVTFTAADPLDTTILFSLPVIVQRPGDLDIVYQRAKEKPAKPANTALAVIAPGWIQGNPPGDNPLWQTVRHVVSIGNNAYWTYGEPTRVEPEDPTNADDVVWAVSKVAASDLPEVSYPDDDWPYRTGGTVAVNTANELTWHADNAPSTSEEFPYLLWSFRKPPKGLLIPGETEVDDPWSNPVTLSHYGTAAEADTLELTLSVAREFASADVQKTRKRLVGYRINNLNAGRLLKCIITGQVRSLDGNSEKFESWVILGTKTLRQFTPILGVDKDKTTDEDDDSQLIGFQQILVFPDAPQGIMDVIFEARAVEKDSNSAVRFENCSLVVEAHKQGTFQPLPTDPIVAPVQKPVWTTISDQVLAASDGTFRIDVFNPRIVTNPPSRTLVITAASDDETLATVSVVGGAVTVKGANPAASGSAVITITATPHKIVGLGTVAVPEEATSTSFNVQVPAKAVAPPATTTALWEWTGTDSQGTFSQQVPSADREFEFAGATYKVVQVALTNSNLFINTSTPIYPAALINSAKLVLTFNDGTADQVLEFGLDETSSRLSGGALLFYTQSAVGTYYNKWVAAGRPAIKWQIIEETTASANNNPRVQNAIPDTTLDLTKTSEDISLEPDGAHVFIDDDGDELTYTVESSLPAIVVASIVDSNKVRLTRKTVGTSVITVKATDSHGAFAQDVFRATVPPANVPTISPIPVTVIATDKSAAKTIDLDDYITAPSGETITRVNVVRQSGDSVAVAYDDDTRVVTFTPITGKRGTTTVALSVTASGGGVARSSFSARVDRIEAVGQKPTINVNLLAGVSNKRYTLPSNGGSVTWDLRTAADDTEDTDNQLKFSASYAPETPSDDWTVRTLGTNRRSLSVNNHQLNNNPSPASEITVTITVTDTAGQSASDDVVVVNPAPPRRRTTDTDYLYRRASSAPRAPDGGTTDENHEPANYSRDALTAVSASQPVYRWSRTRTYEDGVFISATTWGSRIVYSSVTASTDTIYRRGTSTPSWPARQSGENDLPAGWTRVRLSATSTQNVYSSRRTRNYRTTDGVRTFVSATSWGRPTLFASKTGPTSTPLTLRRRRTTYTHADWNGSIVLFDVSSLSAASRDFVYNGTRYYLYQIIIGERKTNRGDTEMCVQVRNAAGQPVRLPSGVRIRVSMPLSFTTISITMTTSSSDNYAAGFSCQEVSTSTSWLVSARRNTGTFTINVS